MSALSGGLADTPESWPVTGSRDLHRDDWVVALRSDTVEAPDGSGPGFARLVLEHPGSVMVLAVDDQDRALVLRQYRHAMGRRMVELPAGLRDEAGEHPERTARRELLEEAELEADHWEHLVTSALSPGISDEVIEVFVATGVHQADRGDFEPAHEEAEMTTDWVPLTDLVEAVLTSRVTDAATQLAVLAYAARAGAAGPRPGNTLAATPTTRWR